MTTLRVSGFLDHSTVNGDGFRTTLFLSGCHHHCPGCHNPESQDFSYGDTVDLETILTKIKKNIPLIDGITLSGGDPFEQHQGVYVLLTKLKSYNLSIWVYTGYTYEALCQNPSFCKLLALIDVLVDGPYIKALHTDTKKYVGSSNQRILQLENGCILRQLHF